MNIITLNKTAVLHKLTHLRADGDWLLAVDPETCQAKIVARDRSGFVAEAEGHEDLFPLSMTVEQAHAYLKGGDWTVAHTSNRRPHDGQDRSYLILWEEHIGQSASFQACDAEAARYILNRTQGGKAQVPRLPFDLSSLRRIDLAIQVAEKAHREGRKPFRKGTNIPYFAHPCAVAMILAGAGYDEDTVIAGLLHDTLEDTDLPLEEIRRRFGERVARIVQGCPEPAKDLDWKVRKQHTLDSLPAAPPDVQAVVCADKVHNVLSLQADYSLLGDQLWKRFNRGKEDQAWYYHGIANALSHVRERHGPGSIFHQLDSKGKGRLPQTQTFKGDTKLADVSTRQLSRIRT